MRVVEVLLQQSVKHLGLDDPIGPEVTKALTQFTPCSDDPAGVSIPQHDGPDHTSRFLASIVGVDQGNLLAVSNCLPDGGRA